jgi:hypothetical protein
MPQRGWIPEIDIGNSNFLYLALENYGLGKPSSKDHLCIATIMK